MPPWNCSTVLDGQLHANTVCHTSTPVSATQRKLVVPRYRLNSFGRRCFAVASLSTWNSLPDSLRDPELSLDTFKGQLKTYFFAKY